MHSIFKICISRNIKCDKTVGFLKYSHNFLSIKLNIDTITQILAKDAILKCEQLCTHITDDYNSDVENICR